MAVKHNRNSEHVALIGSTNKHQLHCASVQQLRGLIDYKHGTIVRWIAGITSKPVQRTIHGCIGAPNLMKSQVR